MEQRSHGSDRNLHQETGKDMSPSKQPAERHIVDETGAVWRVKEMLVWGANGRGATSLIAEHERGFRRLWDFPADWSELSDRDLAELVGKPVRKGPQQAVE